MDEMARQEAEVEKKLRANQDMNYSFFFFYLALSLLLRQKKERSFSFEHLFETDFLLNIQGASKSWNSITRSDIKKTILRTLVLPRFTTLPHPLNYLI